MSIRKTLLEIVQDILTTMGSEPVNSISDTIEAEDVASLCERVYYETLIFHEVPDTKGLLKITAASDSEYPTHLIYPPSVNSIEHVWYDKSTNSTFEYGEVCYVEPLEFLRRTDTVQENYVNVKDKLGTTNLRIRTDKMPDFYTSFDNDWIVMDSYLSTVDDTIQEHKTRSYGAKYPDFNKFSDTAYPDMSEALFPYYIAECTSRAMDQFKGGTTQKIEQAARRQSAQVRNAKVKTNQPNVRNFYGR